MAAVCWAARLGQGLVGQDQVVLPAVDEVLDLVGAVIAGVFLLHDVGEQRLDVAVIEDREAGLVAQARVFLADDVHAQVVKVDTVRPRASLPWSRVPTRSFIPAPPCW